MGLQLPARHLLSRPCHSRLKGPGVTSRREPKAGDSANRVPTSPARRLVDFAITEGRKQREAHCDAQYGGGGGPAPARPQALSTKRRRPRSTAQGAWVQHDIQESNKRCWMGQGPAKATSTVDLAWSSHSRPQSSHGRIPRTKEKGTKV